MTTEKERIFQTLRHFPDLKYSIREIEKEITVGSRVDLKKKPITRKKTHTSHRALENLTNSVLGEITALQDWRRGKIEDRVNQRLLAHPAPPVPVVSKLIKHKKTDPIESFDEKMSNFAISCDRDYAGCDYSNFIGLERDGLISKSDLDSRCRKLANVVLTEDELDALFERLRKTSYSNNPEKVVSEDFARYIKSLGRDIRNKAARASANGMMQQIESLKEFRKAEDKRVQSEWREALQVAISEKDIEAAFRKLMAAVITIDKLAPFANSFECFLTFSDFRGQIFSAFRILLSHTEVAAFATRFPKVLVDREKNEKRTLLDGRAFFQELAERHRSEVGRERRERELRLARLRNDQLTPLVETMPRSLGR